MNKDNIAVGLDIGTTKIVAMIGKKNEYGKLEILGIGKSKSLGVHRGVVNNITQTIQSIQQAVTDAEIDALLAERVEARKSKNFKRSDEIRDLLAAKGIIIEDTPQGARWKRQI